MIKAAWVLLILTYYLQYMNSKSMEFMAFDGFVVLCISRMTVSIIDVSITY